MTEILNKGDLVAASGGIVPAAVLAEELTSDLPEDLAEARTYRRLLEDALSMAMEARAELADAQRRVAVLEHQARTDEVTGLLNRRGFEAAMESALARTRRFGEKGVLVIVDLDGFKAVNDTHGHAAGDLVLSAVGSILSRHTRDTDAVARIGGDEFAIILTEATLDGARKRVRCLDQLLNYATVPWHGVQIPIRASFGTVPYGPKDQAETLFSRADEAMYARKRSRAS